MPPQNGNQMFLISKDNYRLAMNCAQAQRVFSGSVSSIKQLAGRGSKDRRLILTYSWKD